MKTIKNTKKPMIIVDLTNIESCDDIKFEFTRAKAKAVVPLTEEEINSVVAYGAHLTLDVIDQFCGQFQSQMVSVELKDTKQIKKAIKAIEKIIRPKTPWYKKAWNWIKKPFTKKK
jgi:endonuclease III-like uncharacterized protein